MLPERALLGTLTDPLAAFSHLYEADAVILMCDLAHFFSGLKLFCTSNLLQANYCKEVSLGPGLVLLLCTETGWGAFYVQGKKNYINLTNIRLPSDRGKPLNGKL